MRHFRRAHAVEPLGRAWRPGRPRAPRSSLPACAAAPFRHPRDAPEGLFSRATVFDVARPRVLAGAPSRRGRGRAAVGQGGFLTRDMTFRFSQYRAARERGEVE
jgi:hypothetical protein